MTKVRAIVPRWMLAVLFVCLVSFPLLLGSLRAHRSLPLDIGPADSDYTQGLSEFWRYDGERTWREMGRRARLRLPVTLEGPGRLSLSVAQPDPRPLRLYAEFDDGTSQEITVVPSSEFHELHLELPRTRARADVRLRTETADGSPGRLRIDRIEWSGEKARPQSRLAWQFASIMVLSLVTLGVAGASFPASVGVSLAIGGAALAVSFHDPFVAVHLVRRGAVVTMLGLTVVIALRLLARRLTPAFLSLIYGALLLKALLVFHPSFFFTDLPIHQTLLELVYHRGVVDFWTRLPDYQEAHNLGVAPVGGTYQAFPYPVVFYLLAHLGNSAFHAPELWLKLGGALVSALALLPLGFLARRLCPAPHADVAAGLVYLFTPAYTRSLLLLEFSALLGHLLDLIVIAYLAGISLQLFPTRRVLATAALIAASLAVYTSGFIHQGLLVGCLLILAPLLKGLSRSGAVRLAAAGLAGAVFGLLTYHPQTISNLFNAILPAGVDVPTGTELPLGSRIDSAVERSLEFLGGPLLALGAAGLAFSLKRTSLPSLRLLLSAWALSGAIAYFLRYYLLELLRFQKELYWVGALLAVTIGVLAASLRQKGRMGTLTAAALLLAIVMGGLTAFGAMATRFYERYAFL